MLSRLVLTHAAGRHALAAPAGRSYATAAAAGGSKTLLYGGLAALGAGGAYYALAGGAVSPKKAKELEDKAKAKLGIEVPPAVSSAAEQAQKATAALDPNEFRNFKLKEKKEYNHNTAHFVFELPEGKESGLTVASALVTRSPATEGDGALLDDKNKPVIRPYTPVTAPDTKGRLDLLIKKYPDGKMTNFIHDLKPGDELAMKGPIPKFPYKANQFESIGLIAGGSGITPHWQVMQQIASDPSDKTKVILVFSNQTEKDILLRERFDELVKAQPDKFAVTYSLDDAPKSWPGHKGFLSASALKELLPPPSLGEKVKIFVCGPPGQMKAISGPKKSPKDQGELDGALKELGYTAEQVYKF